MDKTMPLNYQNMGKGPAVVLLHDSLMGPESWKHQADALLAAEFRVIIPDFSRWDGEKNLTGLSRSVMSLLDKLGVGRAAFCGMGMGGALLLALLESYQRRIVGACFINTRAGLDDVHEKYKRAEMIAGLSEGDELSARAELLKMLYGGREKHLPTAERQTIKHKVFTYERDALIGNMKVLQTRRDYASLLNRLTLPTQVIYGKEDMICHPGHSRLMLNQLPNCLSEVGLKGGHLLQIEQSARVTAELLDFLKAIVPKRCRVRAVYSLMAA